MATARQRSQHRRRREDTRAQILAAASSALRERPYRELTIEELMAGAGLSRTIFYRHFDDLGDLVVRLLEETGGEFFAREQRVAELGTQAPEDVRRALEVPVRSLAEDGPLLRAVAEAASHDERIDVAYRTLVGRFEALIEANLRKLGTRGYAPVADPGETARALNLMNLAYLLEVFGAPEPKVTPEVALQTLSEIWSALIFCGRSPPSPAASA